jgi:hypothetical protein
MPRETDIEDLPQRAQSTQRAQRGRKEKEMEKKGEPNVTG